MASERGNCQVFPLKTAAMERREGSLCTRERSECQRTSVVLSLRRSAREP